MKILLITSKEKTLKLSRGTSVLFFRIKLKITSTDMKNRLKRLLMCNELWFFNIFLLMDTSQNILYMIKY